MNNTKGEQALIDAGFKKEYINTQEHWTNDIISTEIIYNGRDTVIGIFGVVNKRILRAALMRYNERYKYYYGDNSKPY